MLTIRFEAPAGMRRVTRTEHLWARLVRENLCLGWDWEPASVLRAGDWTELTAYGPPGRVLAVEDNGEADGAPVQWGEGGRG